MSFDRFLGRTLKDASRQAKLPNGGRLLVTIGCVTENYDPSITCYGTTGERSDGKHSRIVSKCLGSTIDSKTLVRELSPKELKDVVRCATTWSNLNSNYPLRRTSHADSSMNEIMYSCYVNGTHQV